MRTASGVNIIGAGSTTITASQNINRFTIESIDASFTVLQATPTLTKFSISNKNISSDVSFTLVDPSSNSPGAFSYSVVGAPNIVSISGKKVTFLGTGITTIRATQAPDTSGNFISNFIDASFSIVGVSIRPVSITYSIGAGGAFGGLASSGGSGGTTTANINGQLLTANGGSGGTYNTGVTAPGAIATGGTTNVSG